MDWNAKWECENLVIFNPKTFESPKQQPTDWGIEEEGVIDTAPFNLSEGKGSTSGSELAQGSSARSSISVCTDSSSKEVMTKKPVAFGAINAFSECFGQKDDMGRAELAETSLPIESSVGYGEPLIGLKLGKRMYFENNGIGSNRKAPSLAGIPVSSAASTAKKIKSSSMITPPLCQVEGCNLDLSSAKEYHRKHRVCESHSKFPKVVVGGLERRFCQQCSRFHSLSDFDEKKRSCRRRLSDHNARRRKPQLDALQINSRRLSSPFSAFACTDGRQQISFASNNVPLVYSRSSTDPTWESACSSKFAISKGCLLKFGRTGGVDGQLQLPGAELPISLPGQSSNRLLLSKGNKDEALMRGFKECALSSNLDAAPDIQRALSLLSNDSWGSFPPANISLDHPINLNLMHQPLMQGFPQNFPQASSEFYHTGHSADPRTLPANDSSHFQLFKAPYDNGLYSNLFN